MSIQLKGDFVQVNDNGPGYDVSIGDFSSATYGVGLPLNSAKTKVLDVCCDDAGANLGSTDVRPIRSRMLMSVAQSGAASIAGLLGQLKNIAADTTTGHKCGVKGYYESVSGATVAATSCGVMGMIDVPSGATAAAGFQSAFLAAAVDLGGTHTGKLVGLNIENPGAGTWDGAFALTTAGGSAASGSTPASGTIIGKVAVYIDGTKGFINVYPTAN